MSDNIPFDIQVAIIKKLPPKSVIQSRLVCKSWNSLITSPCFITDYRGPQQHLLVSYVEVDDEDTYELDVEYVSFVDDNTFPHNKSSPTVPSLVKNFLSACIIGNSHGLLCLQSGPRTDNAVVWNPCIRKAVAVYVPTVDTKLYGTVLGFGVCRETNDVKIVKITHVLWWKDVKSVACMPKQVEVFTLSTRTWRSPYGSGNLNLPRTSIRFGPGTVVVDGVLYWVANDRTSDDGYYHLLVSFDLTTEEFKEVKLPDRLADSRLQKLDISMIRNSLVVLQTSYADDEVFIYVWKMGGGVSKSFTKIFTVTLEECSFFAGFRNSGEPMLGVPGGVRGQLVVYEPDSKRVEKVGIGGVEYLFKAHPYVESLFLFDQPDNPQVSDKNSGSNKFGGILVGAKKKTVNMGFNFARAVQGSSITKPHPPKPTPETLIMLDQPDNTQVSDKNSDSNKAGGIPVGTKKKTVNMGFNFARAVQGSSVTKPRPPKPSVIRA